MNELNEVNDATLTTLAPGSAAVNVTHDSIAPSPAQQAEMKKNKNGGAAGGRRLGQPQPRTRGARGPRGGLLNKARKEEGGGRASDQCSHIHVDF